MFLSRLVFLFSYQCTHANQVTVKVNSIFPLHLTYFFTKIFISYFFKNSILIWFLLSLAATNSAAGNGQQKRNKMRPMNSDDFMRVEQVLQQQVILSSSNKKKTVKAVDSWPNKLDSINSLNSLNSTDDTEEEFYSMSDYNSLPPLAQPPKIGPGLVGEGSNFSGFSPEKSLNAISLGSNNSLLSNRSSPRKGIFHVLLFILASFSLFFVVCCFVVYFALEFALVSCGPFTFCNVCHMFLHL